MRNNQKQQKFLALYQPVHDRFERFCRVRVYGKMDHRDLMNDTLLIAFQKFSELESEKAFLSFLLSICVRVLSNHHKKRKEFGFIDEKDFLNIPGDDFADKTADNHILYKALAKLPKSQKESIILFELTGFSIKEIAALHEVSESTVRQRLVRARKKLAQYLSPASVSPVKNDLAK